MHYLDNSATTPVLPEAAQAAIWMMTEEFGNPSSQHEMGIRAARVLQKSRETVAGCLGASPEEIIFTSCGSESINMALTGAVKRLRHRGGHIITTAIEHAATRNTVKALEGQGFEVTLLPADREGHVTTESFHEALRDDTVLASVMLVNNEIGTVMPVEEMGKALKRKNSEALFHIDAVQGLFRVPLLPQRWKCDLMSVSGHKIGAPKGIGALYIRKGVRIPPLLLGGGQENGLRSGTEAMPGIAAFAKACEVRARSFTEDVAQVSAVREYLLSELSGKLSWAQINGQGDVPHVVNISLPGCKSEVMLRILESEQVYVSAGSACAKGKESSVLRAMGLSKERIDSALRVSMAPFNTKADIDALVRGLIQGAAMLKRG